MRQRLHHRAADETGITLVELMVVMMILGILSGITLPGFIGQRERASDTSSKVEARAAAVAMEAYASDNLGAYQGATGTLLHSMDSSIPAATDVNVPGPNPYGITWIVTTPQNLASGNTYTLIKIGNGRLLADCDVDPNTSGAQHGDAGCPSNGAWNGNY